ncbi:hypothetical protein KTN05_02705 [Paracoccus sp. Z118]|uniref:hypothetical protein n=1 Tax=Paracoccus sp. Z118 TaxID=2851017 RepID=UPI001C2BF94F|nr:hypothetical protein [Paracoccus sp. Z118]MBV0890758.1 hypothetical protein [Paracoccus sp. Z118]
MTLPLMLQLALCVSAGGLAAFCLLLSRRLRRLNDLETGLGGAIAVMTAEIGRLEAGMAAARAEATAATRELAAEIERAKAERAYWALQRSMVADTAPRRPRLRRREAADA